MYIVSERNPNTIPLIEPARCRPDHTEGIRMQTSNRIEKKIIAQRSILDYADICDCDIVKVQKKKKF